MPRVYRHRPLPGLGVESERQVVGEFRRLEAWGLEVNLRMMPWDKEAWSGCGGVPYWDCSQQAFLPAPMVYDGTLFTMSADLGFVADTAVGVIGSLGEDAGVPIGGMGNIPAQTGEDSVVLVGTIDPNAWANPATRRPVLVGGSRVDLEAGSAMNFFLPGVEANEYGYTLQLAADGRTVLAVENPEPDLYLEDTSASNGEVISDGEATTGWKNFPSDLATQPLLLQTTIPAGTQAGRALVKSTLYLVNTSARSGTIIVGVGLDGADPEPAAQQSFAIPGAFAGAVTLANTTVLATTVPSNLTVTTMVNVTGIQALFSLETTDALGLHEMSVSISR